MSKTTSCVVSEMEQVKNIFQEFKTAGFPSRDVSILYPQADHPEKVIPEKGINLVTGLATGAGALGVVGGILGYLVGVGIISIPVLGAFVAAGPFMATFTGTMMGAVVGSCAGFLAGLGIPEYEALVYEKKLKEGWILVSVNTQEDEIEKREAIRQIYSNVGAEHISDIKFIFEGRKNENVAPAKAASRDYEASKPSFL